MVTFFQKLVNAFKSWRFNRQKAAAIRQAQQLANEQRRKFLVLNFNGKPTVISMQNIRHLIKTHRLLGTADFYREMALFTAYPKDNR